jgi:iron complex transport system substrate-binding protein
MRAPALRWWRRLALLLALIVHAAAWPQVVLHDDRGIELAFATPPQRIVSLLPSFTESICVLGACGRLVGIDRFSDWPASVRKLPRLGGLDDAQIERIVALRPDVVLAAPASRAIERLETLGVKVMVLESRDDADVRRTLGLLARMLGMPEAAARVWSDIEREIDAAAARIPADVRGERVYFEIDSTPYVAGPGSFIGQMLSRLGMRNVVPPGLGSFPKLNPEFVVQAQPDIVMASQSDLAGMAARPGWGALRALQEHRSCGFSHPEFTLLTRPGPRMGEAAALLAACLAGLRPPS